MSSAAEIPISSSRAGRDLNRMACAEHHFIPYHAVDAIGSGPALILAPHPDDEVFGCGGALLRHVDAGDPVRVIILTDGGYGGSEDYLRERRLESLGAAALLGYGMPEFWDLPDRGLECGEPLIRRLGESIEVHGAEWVYAPSWWEIHPDHYSLALAATEAVRRCRRPLHLVLYEIGAPLAPNRLLDITAVLERKRAAMACFPSQLALQSYDRQILALNRYRTYTLPRAVQAAEAYRVLHRDELRALPEGGYPGRIPQKSEEWADARRVLAELRAELAAFESRTACLQNLLDELYASTSWRITGPLRWISRHWRALTRHLRRRPGP